MGQVQTVNRKVLQGESTKKKIRNAAAKLFSEKGYADTTTRMVSEKAGVVLSSLNHYYGSKENLLEAVLEEMSEFVRKSYEGINEKINRYLEQGQFTEEETYDLIEELVRKHVRYCFNQKNKVIIDLVARECLFPEGMNHMLSQVMCENIEIPLTNLLGKLTNSKNQFELVTLSRSIIGAIVSFNEKRELVEELYRSCQVEPEFDKIEDEVYIDMMALIEATLLRANRYRKQ